MWSGRAEVGRAVRRTRRGARPAACVPPGRRRRRGTPGRRAPRRPTRRTPVPPPTARAGASAPSATNGTTSSAPRRGCTPHACADRACVGDRRASDRACRVLGVRAGEGEHRPVVVGVDVDVEQGRAARGGQRVEPGVVASLRHVRHALQHRCRVRRSGATAPVECRRCGSDWRSRSTTTRSRASRRCGGRACSRTPRAAEAAGYDSVWLSDHLFLDLAKYGGPPDRHGVFDPIVTLAALASQVPGPRSARSCCARRCGRRRCWRSRWPPSTASAAAGSTSGSARAGTSPSTRRSGMAMPAPGERLARLARRGRGPARPARRRPVHVRRPFPSGVRRRGARAAPHSSGRRRRSSSAARATACSGSSPSSPTGGTRAGSGRRTRTASGSSVLTRACDAIGRDPASVWRSLGLYALCGEDERDLERRFERLQAATPPGVLDGVSLDAVARGTPRRHRREVREQVAGLGGPRRRHPDPRGRRGAVRGRPRSTTSSCWPRHSDG